MVEYEYIIGAISAVSLVAVHEYAHNTPSLTDSVPALTDGTVGSVSVIIATFAFAGILLNKYAYEMND